MPTHSLAPTPFAPPQANNLRGLALMLGAFFVFAGVDAVVKYVTQTLPPVQVVWFRQLGLLVAVLVLLALRGAAILSTGHRRLQILRGVLAGGSAVCFVTGVRLVPLADAIAVTFVAPFMITVMGAVLLKEPVGWHRWSAVLVGFVGMLIVVRPGTGVFQPAMLFILLAAFFFALRQVVSRALSSSDRTLTTVAYTALAGSAVLTPALPFVWTAPEGPLIWGLLVGVAVFAGLGEFLLIKALEIGQAAVVAPAQYSLLIWGTFYGWLIFDQLPDSWTWVGAAVIIASGLYTLYRERLVARRPSGTAQGM